MRFGILVFPGTWSDTDCHHVVNGVLGQEADYIWHKEDSVDGYDAIIVARRVFLRRLPARRSHRSLLSGDGRGAALCRRGAGWSSGSATASRYCVRPASCRAHCVATDTWNTVANGRTCARKGTDTPFTGRCGDGQALAVPVSHGEGNYYADASTIAQLEEQGRILFRYCDPDGSVTPGANPNGSVDNIAGIINEGRNVLGMMPHPERSCETLLGSDDGNLIFGSMIDSGAKR